MNLVFYFLSKILVIKYTLFLFLNCDLLMNIQQFNQKIFLPCFALYWNPVYTHVSGGLKCWATKKVSCVFKMIFQLKHLNKYTKFCIIYYYFVLHLKICRKETSMKELVNSLEQPSCTFHLMNFFVLFINILNDDSY